MANVLAAVQRLANAPANCPIKPANGIQARHMVLIHIQIRLQYNQIEAKEQPPLNNLDALFILRSDISRESS
jgi:hypothetical protein